MSKWVNKWVNKGVNEYNGKQWLKEGGGDVGQPP